MNINWTIDNIFRHPLRWGKCPFNIGETRAYGVRFYIQDEMCQFKKRWVLIFYFHKWFRAFSNYPLNN